MFKNKDNRLVGVDIGSSCVKLVELAKTGSGYKATAASMVDYPEREDGKVKDSEVVSAVKKCFALSKTSTRNAVCSLSGSSVMVRNFHFPSLPEEAVENAVRFEASQECPFEIDECVIDYHILRNENADKPGMRGVFAVADGNDVAARANLVKKAGINCSLMDVECMSLINCLKANIEIPQERSVAIINIGYTGTNISVIDSNDEVFVRDVAFAGKDIIAKIANELDMSAKSVESILIKETILEHDDGDVVMGFRQACHRLVTDVTETLRFYLTCEGSQPLSQIYVCGGFSQVDGLVDILDGSLTTEVVRWNPFDNIDCEGSFPGKDLLQSFGSGMAVAAGLAMRVISDV